MTTLERELKTRGFAAVLDELNVIAIDTRQKRRSASASLKEVSKWDVMVEYLEEATSAAHGVEREREQQVASGA